MMKNYRILKIILAALCLVFSSVYFLRSYEDSKLEDASRDYELPLVDGGETMGFSAETFGEALELRGVDGQTRSIIDLLEVDIDSALGREYFLLHEQERLSNPNIVSIFLDDWTFFKFTKIGTLLKYRKREITKPNLPSDSIVTKKDMLDIANKLITTGAFGKENAGGVLYDIDNIRIRQMPTRLTGAQTVEGSGNYRMVIPRTYMGIRTLSSLSLSVHIDTGTILSITNLPFYAPESMEENVSKDDAIEIASNAARKDGRYSKEFSVTKELTYTADPVTAPLVNRRSILCWVVTFAVTKPDGHKHPYVYSIDCRTGKLRGMTF